MHPRSSRLPAVSALAAALLPALVLLLCGATLARAESGPLFPEEKSGAKSGQGAAAPAQPTAKTAPATTTTTTSAVTHIHESATLPAPASAGTSTPAAGTPPATTAAPPAATTTTVPAGTTPPTATAGPPASATQPGAPATATTTAAAAKHKAAGKTRPSDLAIALAALAALLVLGVLAWGIARWNAWEPAWLLSLRHAFAEGGYHTSASMAELRDWARLGR